MESKIKEVINNICKKYEYFEKIAIITTKDKYLAEELLNYCILNLYERGNWKKLIDANDNNYLIQYFTQILKGEFFSKTSWFYREFMKYSDKVKTDADVNEYYLDQQSQESDFVDSLKNQITEILEENILYGNVEWWESEIYKIYYFSDDILTYKNVESLTKIPSTTCWIAVRKVNEIVKENISKIKFDDLWKI